MTRVCNKKTMKNLVNLLAVLSILVVISAACLNIDRTESQFPACVTPDGRKIGIGNKADTFAINANDGQIIKKISADKKQGAVVCSANNEILAVYSDEIINIETGETYPRRIAGSTLIGINSNNTLVGYNGRKIGKKRGAELEVFVEKPTDKTDVLRLLKLPLEKLDAVKLNKKSYLTLPVKLLNNNNLLVFAGGKPRTIPADENHDFDPDIWGFYKINLENGEISGTKAIDKFDNAVNLFNLPITDATANGKIAAAAFSKTDAKLVVAFNTETGGEIFRKSFDETRKSEMNPLRVTKLRSIAISKDRTKIAIAVLWSESGKGRNRKAPSVAIYDLNTSELISEFAIEDGEAFIASLDNSEIVIALDGKSVVKLNTQDGKEIWKTQLPKR